jgi:TonB-linked SusC/RagA family outer membrane protein
MKDVTVREVLQNIEENSEFSFMFDNNKVDVTRKVSVSVSNETIETILKQLFAENRVKYEVIDRHIVLLPDEEENTAQSVIQQQNMVSGKVIDSSGQPLPGVTVAVKGKTQGTITDANGNYSLSNVQPDAVLVFSFVGMRMQEVEVRGKKNIDVKMTEETIGIEEVVAVGYGTQKKVNLTGAVEQVTSKELEMKAAANLGLALQGLIPNLNVTIDDGNPVKDPTFNIRGGTSFSGNSFLTGSPLILVDGVPMDMNNLNPIDIDNISVIKDASAAAIYGARAAYGVILVTTKKGKKDSTPNISYSSKFSIQKVMKDPDILSSVEWQQGYMNAKVLNGGTYSSSDQTKLDMLVNYANNPETAPVYYMEGSRLWWVANINPWEEAYKDWAPMQDHVISLSGGGARNAYYASLGYRDQDGLLDFGDDYRKTYNASIGFSSDITDWLNIDTKVLFTQLDTKKPQGQSVYTEDTTFRHLVLYAWRSLMEPKYAPADSPVGAMPTHRSLNAYLNDGHIKSASQTLMLKMAATVKIFDSLNFKTDFAYRSIQGKDKLFLPLVWRVEKSWTPFTEGYSTINKTFSKSDYFVYNAYFDFNKVFKDKHEVSGVAGFNQESYIYGSLNAQGLNMITESVPVIKLTTGTQTFQDNESHWAIRGAFVRFNYIYDNKYLFEMNGRYDGTSKFPTASRFKFFPSFSAGWRISEEKFMEKSKPVLSNLKFRGSYGSLGNQDVNNYAYISTLGLTSQVAYIINGTRPIGISAPGLVSADLTWETATTLDFGLDATLFNKLTLNYDWYNRKTKDILSAAEKLPSVLGVSVPQKNSGIMKTTGWEFSAKWNDKVNEFNYSIAFILNDYQSEILKYSGNPQKLISSLYEGRKMGEIWGLETQGIFQTKDEIAAAPPQKRYYGGVWRPGDVRYKDINGDEEITPGLGTVADPGDQKIIGNETPRYQFGLNTTLSWKNFDFNMFWQGVGKRDYWTNSYYYWGYIGGADASGTTWTYYNSWTPDRTDAFFPAFKSASYNKVAQSRYLINAAYARLKDITLGYTLPRYLTKKIKVDNLRIYASGYNLAKITGTPDIMDPEILTDDSYAPVHYYTFGIQAKF